jgi:glycosyltransferase involved in cell wall biosynthesis
MLAAAARLRNEPRIVFLMIGGGKHFEAMARAVKAHGLADAFRFRTYQERTMLRHSLAVSDVHWLSLDPRLEGLIVPSKFYGIAAAGRPIVMIGDQQGEIGRLVRQHRCGVAIAPGDAVTLADTLRRWLEEPQTVAEMGARARQMLEEKFTKAQAITRWTELVDQLATISN